VQQNSDTSIPSASLSTDAAQPAASADDKNLASIPGDTAAPAATDDTANAAEETTEQKQAREKGKFQRRLDRHKERAIRAEVRADLLEKELAAARSTKAPQAQDAEPTRDSFKSDDDYLRAVIDWRADKRADAKLEAERKAREGKETQSQAARGQEEVSRTWTEREKAFQATSKDYTEVVTPYLESEDFEAMSQQARVAIVESEKGPALLDYLARHSDDAERIANLSPTRQVQELGKLEEKLVTAKRPSNAPDPVKPLGQGRSGTKDPSKMSDAEYREFRKASGARWAQ
jgi:hypothetical protein